jgi:hypothetical protein
VEVAGVEAQRPSLSRGFGTIRIQKLKSIPRLVSVLPTYTEKSSLGVCDGDTVDIELIRSGTTQVNCV